MFWCVDFVLCVTFSTLRMRACVPDWKPRCARLYACSFTSKWACLSAYWTRFMCEVEMLQMYSFSAHPWMCVYEYVMETTTSDCLETVCVRMCVCLKHGAASPRFMPDPYGSQHPPVAPYSGSLPVETTQPVVEEGRWTEELGSSCQFSFSSWDVFIYYLKNL